MCSARERILTETLGKGVGGTRSMSGGDAELQSDKSSPEFHCTVHEFSSVPWVPGVDIFDDFPNIKKINCFSFTTFFFSRAGGYIYHFIFVLK